MQEADNLVVEEVVFWTDRRRETLAELWYRHNMDVHLSHEPASRAEDDCYGDP